MSMHQEGNQAAIRLTRAARKLADAVDRLSFSEPVTHRYNPLRYAWDAHRQYLDLAASEDCRVVFLGMNPGPWGMAQTGVPFGEVESVRDWMGIKAEIGQPARVHPKRPVEGFGCQRSEVSGRRLWGLFREQFGSAKRFFRHHFVANYCPLVFMEASGRNRTPDKLPANQRDLMTTVCDAHLKATLEVLKPKFVVGVGGYAESCLRRVVEDSNSRPLVAKILHPSPASPAANRGWSETATRQLVEAGVWQKVLGRSRSGSGRSARVQ